MGVQVHLLASPAVDPYIVREGLSQRVNHYLSDTLGKLITLVNLAAQRGIVVKWRFKGSFVHRVCGLHLEKKLNDIDVFLELPNWGQAESVCKLCNEVFGSSVTKQKTGGYFANYELKSRIAPIDLTVCPEVTGIPDCTSSFNAPMIDVVTRGPNSVELSLMQSDSVPYCSLADSFRLIRDNKEIITEEHALKTPKGLIRHIHSLIKGPVLENMSLLSRLQKAYCRGFFTQYNNPRGLNVLADNLKNHVFKHFDLENPDERKQVDRFFDQFTWVIEKCRGIPTHAQREFIDKQRVISLLREVQAHFRQKPREEPQPFLRYKTLADYLRGIQYAQHLCEPHHYIPMAERLMSLLEFPLQDPELKVSVQEHIELLLKKLGGVTRDKLERMYLSHFHRPEKRQAKKENVITQTAPTLQKYVQNADLIKKTFPRAERVSHLSSLLRKEKNQGEIEGLEGCVHSLLLELEEDKKNLTRLALLFFQSYSVRPSMLLHWIVDSLERGNVRRAQALYALINANEREGVLQEICSAIQEKSLPLPAQSRKLCLEWLVNQFSQGSHFFLFLSFTHLISEEEIQGQIDWITSLYSKVANREKAQLNQMLSDMMRRPSYEAASTLYQKIQEKPDLFPLPLFFEVFQQVAILTHKQNRSTDFLLQGLTYLNAKGFYPSEENILKKFPAVFRHVHITVKEAYCCLMRLPMPNDDLSKEITHPLLLKPAKKKKIPEPEASPIPPSVCSQILKKALSLNGLVAAAGGSLFLSEHRDLYLEGFRLSVIGTVVSLSGAYGTSASIKYALGGYPVAGGLSKANLSAFTQFQKLIRASSLIFTLYTIARAPENMNRPHHDLAYIFVGVVLGWYASNSHILFLLNKMDECASGIAIANDPIDDPHVLTLSPASLFLMNAYVIKIFGHLGKDFEIFDINVLEKICTWSSCMMTQIANFATNFKKPSLLNRVTLYPFPFILSYGDPFLIEAVERAGAISVITEHVLPELKHTIKKPSLTAFAISSIHILNLVSEVYFTFKMMQAVMNEAN